jgi:hypothetical protein
VAAADRAHRRAQTRLADQLQAALAALIGALPEPRAQTAMELYNRQAVRLVGGGQRRAAQLALAYVGRLVAADPGKAPASVGRALAEVAIDGESPVARSPVLRLWSLIDAGERVDQAREAAGSYAGALATGDLQAAERAALAEGARAGEREPIGWTKELSGDACDWCQSVAADVYRSPDEVPFHERDRCSVAPIFDREVPGE